MSSNNLYRYNIYFFIYLIGKEGYIHILSYMILHSISSYIIISFFVSILLSFLIKDKINNKNEKYSFIVSKDYKNLLREAYKRECNIDNEIKSIKKLHQDITINTFYLLDGIRIYAKSIRLSNYTYGLKYTDGDIGMYYFQMKHYNNIINDIDKTKRIKNICEIGFQVGVGAITLITSVKHNVDYYGFDLGLIYSKNIFKIISKHFSMNMIWGESEITVPAFYKTNHNFKKCDVIHIDGSHSQNTIYNDILNMKNISNPNSLILLDDVNQYSRAIVKAKEMKMISNVKCLDKPYCIAFYT